MQTYTPDNAMPEYRTPQVYPARNPRDVNYAPETAGLRPEPIKCRDYPDTVVGTIRKASTFYSENPWDWAASVDMVAKAAQVPWSRAEVWLGNYVERGELPRIIAGTGMLVDNTTDQEYGVVKYWTLP